MRSLLYLLRMSLAIATVVMLMVMPVLADAPYPATAPASTVAKVPTGHVPQAPARPKPQVPAQGLAQAPAQGLAQAPVQGYVAAAGVPVAPGLLPYPPCQYCGMYHPDPHMHRVPAPQLQNAAPYPTYTPSYVQQGATALPQGYPQSPSVMPNTYGVGGYVSNLPTPAGPNASLGEVWMKSGGARLQYDALRGPIQMYTNGRPLKDPALVHAPPLYPAKQPSRVQNRARVVPKQPVAHVPAPVKTNPSPKPQPQQVTKPATPPQTQPRPMSFTQPPVRPAEKPTMPPTQVQAQTQASSTASTNVDTQQKPNNALPQNAVSRPITSTFGSRVSPYNAPAEPVGSN